MLEAVVRLGHPGAGEGVGLHDVRARLEVSLVDLVDDVRAGDGQKVVISLQRLHMISQLLVAEIWFLQFVLLTSVFLQFTFYDLTLATLEICYFYHFVTTRIYSSMIRNFFRYGLVIMINSTAIEIFSTW